MNKENCEEHPRKSLASTSNVPRSQEDYISQVSKEIEGRVTKKLSQEISRTEKRILGALAKLDDFLMNPLLQGHSGTTPETSRNIFSVHQGATVDDSQKDPHPEAGLLTSGREDHHDMATGVQRERESTQAHDKHFFKNPNCARFEESYFSSRTLRMENVQTFFCSENPKFLRRFDSSTNAPLNNFHICLRAIRYMTKAFTLTVIIQVLRKFLHFFTK